MVDLFRGRKWDLVGYRKLWFAISLAVIVPGVIFWATRGLNYGIDFRGGGLVTYRLARSVESGREADTLAKAREAISGAGVDARLQIARDPGEEDLLLVRTLVVARGDQQPSNILEEQKSKMLPPLSQALPGITEVGSELVTAIVSKELMKKAIGAVAWGCVFILLWIRVRYLDFKWSSAALVALVHDVLVLIGVFAMTQREVNSPFVAAALTVVGYSVHDTIVIFDRIRENVRLRKGATFAETTNISLLETMPRSVNTVLTTELVLIAVYFLGGASLRNFAFAMIVGISVGAYSSIFNAGQLLVVLKNMEERRAERRRAAAGAPARSARRPMPVRARPRSGGTPQAEPRARKQAAEEARADETVDSAEPEEAPSGAEEAGAKASEKPDRARKGRRKLKAARRRKKRF